MKLTKGKYDLSLNQVSMLFETGDIRLLSRWAWLPPILLRKSYARFMFEFGELFNAQEVDQMIDSDIMRMKIANRMNVLLPSLHLGLVLTGDKYFVDLFRQMYGFDPKSLTDLEVIITEIKRLAAKLREIPAPTKGEKIGFEELISMTETILERSIDRNMKLYQFKFQYDLAIKRAKQMEKGK